MPTPDSMKRLTELYELADNVRYAVFNDESSLHAFNVDNPTYRLADLLSDLILEVKQLQLEVTNLGQQLSDLRNR